MDKTSVNGEKNTLVLVIDDQVENIRVLINILREYNYKTAVATNGREALEFVEKTLPDIILLDIMMPGMDGYEVCRKLKENPVTREIPVIFLTALNTINDMVKGFEVGGIDYISKPFKQEELLVRMKTHIDLRNSQKIIEEQNKRLVQINNEKNEIMSLVAHDLKNPINTIVGFAKLVAKQKDHLELDEIGEYLTDIQVSAETMFQIVNNLLDINSLEEGKMNFYFSQFNVDDVIAGHIEHYNVIAEEKNIEIVFEAGSDNKIITSDINKFRQIFDNLLSNAVKFTPHNKKVYVRTFIEKDENNTERISFSIRDEGPGISEEDRKLIFRKFAKLSARPTGNENSTGLGLSIVKKLLENLEGEIDFRSKLNEGTEFIVKIPKNPVYHKDNPEMLLK